MDDPRDFILANLNLLALGMFHAKKILIWCSSSWEEDFFMHFPIYYYVKVSWEEDFWRFIKIFLILPLIGPQKGPAPLFEQIWIPIHQGCFLPSLVEIGLAVIEKKSFKRKSWQRTLRHGISSHSLRPGEQQQKCYIYIWRFGGYARV